MNLFLPRLRELLAESGKMQKDICDELGISKQKLSNWKTGYSEPNFDDIIMLAKYFDVSSDYLLGLTDEYEGNRKKRTHRAGGVTFGRKRTFTQLPRLILFRQSTRRRLYRFASGTGRRLTL